MVCLTAAFRSALVIWHNEGLLTFHCSFLLEGQTSRSGRRILLLSSRFLLVFVSLTTKMSVHRSLGFTARTYIEYQHKIQLDLGSALSGASGDIALLYLLSLATDSVLAPCLVYLCYHALLAFHDFLISLVHSLHYLSTDRSNPLMGRQDALVVCKRVVCKTLKITFPSIFHMAPARTSFLSDASVYSDVLYSDEGTLCSRLRISSHPMYCLVRL